MDETPTTDVPVERPQLTPWNLWAGALMLVAGVIHLILAPTHLTHARGVGLYFVIMGIAQIVWAVAYIRAPSPRLGTIGLMAMVLAPTILYIVTRIWRAPWSDGPEAVDVMGITTVLAQVAAGIPLFMQWRPGLPSGSSVTVAVMGLALALGGYTGAIGAEASEWLSEAEAPHIHGIDDHGNHAEDITSYGVRGQSVIGTIPYFGPETGSGIQQACNQSPVAKIDCWTEVLKDILVAKGSVYAFDVLEELMAVDAQANRDSHAIAHGLGRFAYQAYGYDIGLTLGECSYDVFQGCLHGALQIFFDDVAAQGGELDKETIRSTCSTAVSDFEIYACLHGVGHGVTLYTNYAMQESLELCALLEGWYAQESCYGGVWMENVVGYADSLNPTAAGGHQGHGGHTEPPEFWVRPNEPAYPCNVVETRFGDSCWRMQTSLILRFNNGDFTATAAVCEDAGQFRIACYNSLGRDAATYTDRNPEAMSRHCSHGDPEENGACVEGFAAGEVLQENNPDAGMVLCGRVWEQHKDSCYFEVGEQTSRMWDADRTRAFCDQAAPYEASCLRGARLD